MKKILALTMTLILILTLLAGCGNSNDNNGSSSNTGNENGNSPTSTTEEQTTSDIPQKGGFDAEEAAKNFKVTEYKINDRFNYYAVYIVKNTSEFTLDINGKIEAFNGTDIVGAKEGGEYAIPAGKEIVLAYSFDESFSKTEYKFTAQVSSLYKGVTQDLTFTSSTAKNKEILTVTNNGTLDAEFVQATVLFFKNSNLVFLNTAYVSSGDALKPNESKSTEIACSEVYDSIQVFLTGRSK